MTDSTIEPFEASSGATSYSVQNGVSLGFVGPIPSVYRKHMFTVILLNQGNFDIVITTTDNNGVTRQFLMPQGGPGLTKDNIPWELIAGGLQAKGNGGGSLLYYDVSSSEVKRDNLLPEGNSVIELPHINPSETTRVQTLVREFAVT